MATPFTSPKVFISHTSKEGAEKEWVLQFATDLRAAGIDATLDLWDLHYGDDLTSFMVERITNADHVLMLCTPSYAQKASHSFGGVAFEHMIISGAIHTFAADPKKFLPILRHGNPSEAIPLYLQNRYFIDFREEALYQTSLHNLVGYLLQKPLLQKPPLGEGSAVAPHATPSLKGWVLVAGTGSQELNPKVKETAQGLGRLLAKLGYGLITCGWSGVDEISSRAFALALDEQDIPLEDFLMQVVVESKLPAFPAGRLVFVAPGEKEWTESIKLANTIILLEGIGGTYTTGAIALQKGKPILPLADTQGDALKLFTEVQLNWNKRPVPYLSLQDFIKLGREAPSVLKVLPALLEKIHDSPKM